MLTGICTLFPACSEQEEIESLMDSTGKAEETVDVTLGLSLSPEVYLNGNTDYQPMSTRAGEAAEEPDKVLSIIQNIYKCLVLKEIGNQWYVDRLVNLKLTDQRKTKIGVTATTKFNDLHLTLQPGHYKILAVLNPETGTWNPGLVPGAIVKNEADTITHAYTYYFEMSYDYGNRGKRQIAYEIFSGTADFTVEKTSDLHTDPINGNRTISFTRRVMNIRYLLKDNGMQNSTNFISTPYTVYATLKATEEANFCDGLDCWGKAYYNRQKPTRVLDMQTTLWTTWRTADNNSRYLMISRNATVYSPFVFTDDEQPVPYQMEVIISGQSGNFSYIYRQPIEHLTLTNNTMQQIVFQATEDVDDTSYWPGIVTLEHLESEDSMYLFDKYYENSLTPIN